jgi:hypothetical protein
MRIISRIRIRSEANSTFLSSRISDEARVPERVVEPRAPCLLPTLNQRGWCSFAVSGSAGDASTSVIGSCSKALGAASGTIVVAATVGAPRPINR